MKNLIKLKPIGVTFRMVGHLKDHENNLPMRPIVARCD